MPPVDAEAPRPAGWLARGLLLALALCSGGVQGATGTPSCLAEQERLEQLRERAATLATTRDALWHLREGKVDASLPLGSLLQVDLSQEVAVQQRIRELEAALERAPEEARPEARCEALREDYTDALNAIRIHQADVEALRLAFLRLPAAQRAHAADLHALAVRAEVLRRYLAATPTSAPALRRPDGADSTDTTGNAPAPPASPWPQRQVRLGQLRDDIMRLLRLAQETPDATVRRDVITAWRQLSDRPLLPHGHRLFSRESTQALPDASGRALADVDYRLTFLQAAALREAVRLRADVAFAGADSSRWEDAGLFARDAYRELRDIPVFLLLPVLSTAAALARDADGWRALADAVIESLAFVVALWLAIRLARRSPVPMARLHDHIVARVTGRSSLDWLGALLRIASPFTPWLIAWLAIDLILLVAAIDSGLVALWFAPLARCYILFHVLRLALEGLYTWLPARGGPMPAAHTRAVARVMTLLFFLAWLAGAHAGDALLARMLQPLAWCTSWVLLALLYRGAGDALLAQAGTHLDALGFDRAWATRLTPSLAWYFGWLLIPVWLSGLLLLALVHLLHEQLLHIDAYRRLVLRSMRLRMAAEGEGNPVEDAPGSGVPADYLALFAQDHRGGSDIPVQVAQRGALRSAIDDWLRDHHDENALALIADPGMGKSQVLDELAGSFTDRLRVCRLASGPRITDAAGLLQALAGALDEPLPGGLDSLVANDAARPPTLLLIDEAQHLFLARVGGLDAWRALLAAVNLPLQNLYWCVVIDAQSWLYLSDVFGGRYQFPRVVRLRQWHQDDIRSLILGRHSQGHHALRYEDVLLRSRHLEDTGSLQSVEQRFFGLLWDSAHGNPALALALWRDSINLAPGRVIVARTPPSTGFNAQSFSDTGLFVLTAIVRHGALTPDDIVAVTDLPLAAVRHALKTGLDQGVIASVSGHYRISLGLYYPLVAHLTGKNLLHE